MRSFKLNRRLNLNLALEVPNHHPSISSHLSRRQEKNSLLSIRGKLSHHLGLNHDSCITHADDYIPLGPVKPENKQLSPIYHRIDG